MTGTSGVVLIVCGTGPTMKQAQRQAYNRVRNVMIPNMYYQRRHRRPLVRGRQRPPAQLGLPQRLRRPQVQPHNLMRPKLQLRPRVLSRLRLPESGAHDAREPLDTHRVRLQVTFARKRRVPSRSRRASAWTRSGRRVRAQTARTGPRRHVAERVEDGKRPSRPSRHADRAARTGSGSRTRPRRPTR